MRLFKSILFSTGLAVAFTAAADDAAIKYRQNQMASLGGHMGSIVALVKGEVTFADHLPMHARALADTAVLTEAVFKEQASSSKSVAKDEIWADWEQFAKRAEDLRLASSELAQATADGDRRAIQRHVAAVGKACKSCHDRFKDKH